MQVFDQRGSAPHLEPWSRQDKSGICSNASSWHFGILRLVPFFHWWFLLMQVFDRHSQVLLDLGDLSHLGVELFDVACHRMFAVPKNTSETLSLAFVHRPSKHGIENVCTPSLLPDRKKDAPWCLLRANPHVETPSGMGSEHHNRLLMTDLLRNHGLVAVFCASEGVHSMQGRSHRCEGTSSNVHRIVEKPPLPGFGVLNLARKRS
jgi:hypothetical protein